MAKQICPPTSLQVIVNFYPLDSSRAKQHFADFEILIEDITKKLINEVA